MLLRRGIKTVDKIILVKNLALMLRSGVALLEAIKTLKESSQGVLLKILNQVSLDLERGSSLSMALAKFERDFGQLFINFIKIGEESGTLEENLFRLAQFYEKIYSLRKKAISSLIYPSLVVGLSVTIGAVLSFFVFPKLIPFFQSLKIELPLPTRILLWLSKFTKDYFLLLIAGTLIIIIIATFFIKKNEKLRYLFHLFVLNIPIFGKIFINYNIAFISRTIGSLQKSGIHLQHALKLTAESTNNLVYKKIILEIAEWIRNGQDITSFFRHARNLEKYFPKIMTKMVEVGEHSGNLEEIFIYNADFYENEVDETTKNLSNIIEPVMLIFIGLFVAFIAISIISPIYQITRVLEK